MKVFVSHKAEDAITASLVSYRLKLNGADVHLDLIDPDSATADDLAEHIREKLGACSDLIAVVSAKTKASWWVPWEIGVATEKEFPLATFSSDNSDIPLYLMKWPYLRRLEDIDKYVTVRQQTIRNIQENYSYKSASARQPIFVKQFHSSLKKALGQ